MAYLIHLIYRRNSQGHTVLRTISCDLCRYKWEPKIRLIATGEEGRIELEAICTDDILCGYCLNDHGKDRIVKKLKKDGILIIDKNGRIL